MLRRFAVLAVDEPVRTFGGGCGNIPAHVRRTVGRAGPNTWANLQVAKFAGR